MRARAVACGLLLEVRPLPMAAALCFTLLGFGWAQGRLSPAPPAFGWLVGSVFFGLYTAHLTDTFVDVVRRGDPTPATFPLLFRDSSGLLPDRAYPPLIAVAAALCALFAVPAAWEAGLAVALPIALGLGLALTYAPLLDRSLAGVSLGYPMGAIAAFTAGYGVGGGSLDLRWALLSVPVVVALVGTKVRSDIIDLEEDRRIGKRTVPLVVGERRALVLGYGMAVGGCAVAAALPWTAGAPVSFVVPPAGAIALMLATARADPFRGSMAMASAMFALLLAELAVVAAYGA